MFCSKCGAVVTEGAGFCGACGEPAAGVGVARPISPVLAPAAVQPAVMYAGFWLRFVAFIIDAILLWIVGAMITLPLLGGMGLRAMLRGGFGANGGEMRPEDMLPFVSMIFRIVLISLILKWLYFALLESSSWQATLGKKALGLEVTDTEGRRIGFGRATGRFFGKIISGMILYIGFIMAGFTEKKQALHDMMAGCLVIRKI